MSTAAELHRQLEAAVRQYREAEKSVVSLFGEILLGRLYISLGYSSIYEYAVEALGFSKSKTAHLIRLARAMRELPELREAVERRELEWSKGVEVARAASPESARQWVDVAKRSSRKELRRRIRAAKPAKEQLAFDAAPAPLPATATIRHTLSATQLERYERAMEKLRKKGTSEAELLVAALESFAGATGESDGNATIVVHECERCSEQTVKTSNGTLRVPDAEARQLRCDATIQRAGRRRKTIPPKTRRLVL